MPDVPNTEPQSLTAGETWAWSRSISDYPATSWTLKYALQTQGKPLITITATASGTNFAVAVPANTTGSYEPGAYVWTAYVEQGASRYAVARGILSVLPSPLSALGETHATRTLALIEAALENRIPNGLESSDIDGQQITKIGFEGLHRLKVKYQRDVLAEQKAAEKALGIRRSTSISIRFVNR